MKKLFALLLCLCLMGCFAACDKHEHTLPEPTEEPPVVLVDDGVKHTVHAMTEYVYMMPSKDFKNSFAVDINEKNQITVLQNMGGNDGDTVVEISYGSDYYPTSMRITINEQYHDTVRMVWDENGNLLNRDFEKHNEYDRVYTYNRMNKVIQEGANDGYYENIYDADGLFVGYRWYRNGMVREVQDSQYALGVMRSNTIRTFDEQGNLSRTTVENYDEHGNMTSQAVSYVDDTHTDYEDTYTYTYDQNGNMLTSDFYRDGEFKYGYSYTYDDRNNCISESTDGKLDVEYEYDQDDRRSGAKYYEDGELLGTAVYTYDEHGNQLSYVYSDLEGNLKSQRTATYEELTLTTAQYRVYQNVMNLMDDLGVLEEF